ncbi:hypothetical protein [Ornithinimicrobium murale]|uniref:hypothetical protein n=1 Tax=Ornithinimicrobium murale TaxID=1050153 RepID=UPI0013B364FA|nr:hypothetical protein [Ornithinimicrobium murale]
MIDREAAPGLDQPARDRSHLVASTVGTGVLMLVYLLSRPYGDAAGAQPPAAGEAFADSWWVISHVAGLLALASYARLAMRFAELTHSRLGSASRTCALGGLVLVLPYFGAETFALHVLGREATAGRAEALDLVEPIRNQPVALTMFGLGLVLLAISAILLGLAWQRSRTGPTWAVWPLMGGVVLFLPQFFLPPTGRMAYGVACALAAVLMLVGLRRGPTRS